MAVSCPGVRVNYEHGVKMFHDFPHGAPFDVTLVGFAYQALQVQPPAISAGHHMFDQRFVGFVLLVAGIQYRPITLMVIATRRENRTK